VPPEPRPIPRFVAEQPQEATPYGRWAERLADRFREACRDSPDAGEASDPGEVSFFPDRSYAGVTFVPASAPAGDGGEWFGFVAYRREPESGEPTDFGAHAEFTDETAEENPDWELDLSDHVLSEWRGPEGRRGQLTLVWGRALVPNGAIATAELGPTTTDQCVLVNDRFTLVSLDDYTGDLITVKLFGARGGELASESLYEGE
jgi:hypothetical protein